jgi:hypothetical protein
MKRKFFLLSIFLFPACTNVGFTTHNSSLEVHSMGLDRSVLKANCSTIVCTDGFANEGDIWMTDIPTDLLEKGEFSTGQIIHLQLLWKPVAGKTPLVSTSTNVSIKHYIMTNGIVGVYSGGGFCWPSGSPKNGLSLFVEEANLTLQDSSSGFNDLLSPATMSGRVTAIPNSKIARQIANAAEFIAP